MFIGDGLGIVKVVHYFCLLEGKREGCVFFRLNSVHLNIFLFIPLVYGFELSEEVIYFK